MQQKMSMTSVGVTRRQLIFEELTIKPGQTIIDVGCGGGQFVEELALRLGAEGLAIGVDPSEAQLSVAKASCEYLKNTKFLSCSAGKIDVDSNSCDAVTFTQTLEYIEDVDSAIKESKRLSKSGAKFVNVSTLWDFFSFHGPDENLNTKMHDVIRGQKHPMLPTQLNGKLERCGFENIRTKDISFYLTTRDEFSSP